MKYLQSFILFSFAILFINVSAIAQTDPGAKLSESAYAELLDKHFDRDGPGASVLVMKKGENIYRNAIGFANLELEVLMKPEHVHRIGSITKQFTAVAILMLWEQGKLDLQDPITKFIPDYPTKGKTITVEHLLTHTSGIKSMTGMPGFFEQAKNDISTTEMMDYFKNEPMDFDPGEEFRYNNSGYYLLGVIIENLSGKTYADFIQANIIGRTGMHNSHYGGFQKLIPMRADGYEAQGEQYVNAAYLSMTQPYAAGALVSNVDDLYNWYKALFSYQLIKKETLEKAFEPYQLNNGEYTEYGYGWGVGTLYGSPKIEHGGGIPGFLTQCIYLPEEELFVVVFSNCNCQSPSAVAELIAGIESESAID